MICFPYSVMEMMGAGLISMGNKETEIYSW